MLLCRSPTAELALASREIQAAVTKTTVLLMNTQTPPPLLLLESRVLSWCCAVQPASSIAESKMDECSQVSVSSRMQLALPVLFVATSLLVLQLYGLASAFVSFPQAR
ncbi:hypothetical protein GOODEAATRI_016927 [Goodea atripinnis]|uniref:Uncharacterized protein n=1 Tax=Goodea atripinnis TaxID=208336 RepID=A0ABV0PZ75_9TELE